MPTRRKFLAITAATLLAGSARGNDYPPVRAVTRGPKHHFFGYYDKTPWDLTGRYLLANEVDFVDRQPKPTDELTVGMVDLHDSDKFIPLDTTKAWCWQQGTMLQWLGSAADREVIYNSVAEGKYVSIIRDVHSGKTRLLPRPIYAVRPDGRSAVTLDFARLGRLRPGYGYEPIPDQFADQPAPKEVGIWRMNLSDGKSDLLVSLAELASFETTEKLRGPTEHWLNHLQFAPSGNHFAFLHRWRQGTMKGWFTRLFRINLDGSGLKLLVDTGMVSHYDWRDDQTILGWMRGPKGDRFYLLDTTNRSMNVIGEGVLTTDGHCSYSPDRKLILNDTYPLNERMQTLMIFDPATGKRRDIGKFHSPPRFTGPIRCDLHPRWRRDGRQVCIDSSHEPTRQVYVIDLG